MAEKLVRRVGKALSALTLIAASIFAPEVGALPAGAPPPKRMPIPAFWWNCVGEVQVSMQAKALVYEQPTRKSRVLGSLKAGERVTVLEEVGIVVRPGIARVVGPFRLNHLNLTPGTEVYVLAEWEIDYHHAWYAGAEVEGGLPIGDSDAFKYLRKSIVEGWIRISSIRKGMRTGWALDGNAFKDGEAIGACKSAGQQ